MKEFYDWATLHPFFGWLIHMGAFVVSGFIANELIELIKVICRGYNPYIYQDDEEEV